MAISTRLGPWLLGTRKNSTGTTALTLRNLGATVVAQSLNIAYTNATANTTAFAIPAGSLILEMYFITTTVFSAATTIKLSIGATDLNAATTVTAVGPFSLAVAATSGATAAVVNTGLTDVIVTYTLVPGASATGAGTIIIKYVVRNPDGTIVSAP